MVMAILVNYIYILQTHEVMKKTPVEILFIGKFHGVEKNRFSGNGGP